MQTQLHFPFEDLIKYSQLTRYLILPKWSETDFEHSQKSPVVSPDGFLDAVCTIAFHAYAHVLAWQPVKKKQFQGLTYTLFQFQQKGHWTFCIINYCIFARKESFDTMTAEKLSP